MKARYGSTCPWCTEPIRPGDAITLAAGRWRHDRCDGQAHRPAAPADSSGPRRAPAAPGLTFACERCADLGFVTAEVWADGARTVPCECSLAT